MAMTHSISKLQHKLALAKKSTVRAREKAGELMETALESALTGGSAFALGIWEGRAANRDDFEVFGIPAPLVIAGGAHAAALFGVGRGMEQHFRSVGNGAIAAHLNGVGRSMGQQWRATGSLSAPGAAPSSSGPSPADLVNRARGG